MFKKIVFILLFLVSIIVVFLLFNYKTYKQTGIFELIYPRSWHIKNINEASNVFNGLVISQEKIDNDEASYNKGGFIEISTSPSDIKYNLNISDYIVHIKENETLRIQNGGSPIIPGPSQFEYIGKQTKIIPMGFEEVSGTRTAGSNTEAHLYWKIKHNKLYEIFVKYPKNNSKKTSFELGVMISSLFFKIL